MRMSLGLRDAVIRAAASDITRRVTTEEQANSGTQKRSQRRWEPLKGNVNLTAVEFFLY